MHANYRLGLDIGTNSLGWCVLDLGRDGRPRGIRRMGVRIFSDSRDPQSGTSLAVERRLPRQQRRRRDRYLDRRADLLATLVQHGLMPTDADEADALFGNRKGNKHCDFPDPYELRARGLDEPLPLHHLGRALFHLNQRRGFKSNRKTDRPLDPEKAKEAAGMKQAIGILDRDIERAGCRTLGEYLYKTARLDEDGNPRSGHGSKDGKVKPMLQVRARPYTVKGRNAYDFYPSRAMYEQEFDLLWKAQAAHHPELTDRARDKIRGIIFFQRQLKPVDPGKCALDSEDRRAPLALPIVQQFRILQELANLRLEDPLAQTIRRLSLTERDKLFAKLRGKEKLSFSDIRRTLQLGRNIRINLEENRRPELKGDIVSKRLADDRCFGAAWFELPEARQTEIVSYLLDEPEEEKAIGIAQRDWGLTEEQAHAVSAVALPDGYGRIGLRALGKIVPIMLTEADGNGEPLHYSEAAERAGYDHSDRRTGEIFDRMPYYGQVLSHYVADVKSSNASPDEREYGRIANPTVHVGLNQLRRLINALIDRYGHPAGIVVELARDLKLNMEEKERLKKLQTENKRKNDQRRQKLLDIGQSHRADGLLRLRLWEELNPENCLDRHCVYTGEQINIEKLFSDKVEIDHILPFQDSLDDSPANLTVCLRAANRDKRKQTPYDAFSSHPGYDWDAIVKRSASLPSNKRWRFRPDALDMVRDRGARDLARAKNLLPKDQLDDIERTGGFLARQLIDTAYVARVARQYLWTVCNNPNAVWVVPGRMTEFMRRKWGLNKLLYGNRPDPDEGVASGAPPKLRNDHRHHAIDAFVVGLTDPGMLQKVSTAAGQAEERLIENMPEPWTGFRDDVKSRLDRLVISYKPDHGLSPSALPPHTTTGRLNEATAYGVINSRTLVRRKALEDLTAGDIKNIRDDALRNTLIKELGRLLFDDSKLEAARTALQHARRRRDAAAIAEAATTVKKLKEERRAFKKSAVKDLKSALIGFGQRHDIRRVRIKTAESEFIPVRNRKGEVYKALIAGENHCIDFFTLPDGTWQAEGITVFSANQPGFQPAWQQQEGARLIMRLHKGDLLKLQHDGREQLFRVVKLVPSNEILWLAEHREAGNLEERNKDLDDSFSWLYIAFSQLKVRCARKVTVDIFGRVRDPGPPA